MEASSSSSRPAAGENEGGRSVVGSSPPSPVSTRSDDLISRVDIAEITDVDDYQSLSTSAVLFRCKHKILKPYLRLLATMGLRSFGTDRPNVSKAIVAFGYLHLLQVIVFTALGYVLQFMVCFRRDRGFCKTGDIAFGFVLPSLLHFGAYAYALYLFRFKETEKLENLMERTFLLSAHRTDGRKKAHLVRSLWIFIYIAILWLVLSLSSVVVLTMRADNILEKANLRFLVIFTENQRMVVEAILVLSTLWQDMVQATVITSYCLQAQLLIFSLYFLRAKLLQHTIQPLSWIREVNECQNFLNYLNNDFSPSVCIFIFVNMSWAASGAIGLAREDSSDQVTNVTAIVVVCLWLVAVIVPFVMAAWLTSACTRLRLLGHEVRIRPFVYQDTPGEDLDTILLYTSTLKLTSKLFGVPVHGRCLFCCVTLIAVSVMVTGMSRSI